MKQKKVFLYMLKLDSKGHLTPYKPIFSTVEEIREVFVNGIDSKTRQDNFNKYIKYSNDLKKVLGGIELKQWFNGSFVTKKTNPKDIDLVTFLDIKIISKLGNKLDKFKPPIVWDIYEVDAYILEVHPEKNNIFTKSDIAYWLDRFGNTRRNRNGNKYPKGFLEIYY